MLYERDYRILTADETEQIKKAEEYVGKRKYRITPKELFRYHSMRPEVAEHYESLFPNNLLNVSHLEKTEWIKSLKAAFLNLLDSEPNEREILNFISANRAYFIIGSLFQINYDFGHHKAYAFKEFQLPPNYIADYLLIGKNSGGHEFVFVELESPSGQIVNADGTIGPVMRKGIKQIETWDTWLEGNFSHLQLMFEKHQGINPLPEEFLKLDKSRIHYVVIAGRRKDFKANTYRYKRKLLKAQNILLLHYDNLVDGIDLLLSAVNY
jgi:hypothetical protein